MVCLADRQRDGWALLDAESIAERHPSSFLIPAFSERDELGSGDFAKVIFSFDVEGEDSAEERMWVKVSEKVSSGYVGTLDNMPTLIAENDMIWLGSEVFFQPRHIIEVLKGKWDAQESWHWGWAPLGGSKPNGIRSTPDGGYDAGNPLDDPMESEAPTRHQLSRRIPVATKHLRG